MKIILAVLGGWFVISILGSFFLGAFLSVGKRRERHVRKEPRAERPEALPTPARSR